MDKCNHFWVERKDGYEEQCGASICLVCGKYGCYCKLKISETPRNLRERRKQLFYELGINGDKHKLEKEINE